MKPHKETPETLKLVPATVNRAEITVVNSRFIASVSPSASVEEAREFISRVKSEFKDASHNVPAFIIGHGASTTEHCHDDGEPSGTAGQPVLAVLRGSKLGDIVVVVTRYFGGTKLGTGGLVRAYSEAARQGIADLPVAQKVMAQRVRVNAPYTYYERLHRMVLQFGGEIIEEIFQVDVSLLARFPVTRVQDYSQAVSQLAQGKFFPQMEGGPELTLVPVQ